MEEKEKKWKEKGRCQELAGLFVYMEIWNLGDELCAEGCVEDSYSSPCWPHCSLSAKSTGGCNPLAANYFLPMTQPWARSWLPALSFHVTRSNPRPAFEREGGRLSR